MDILEDISQGESYNLEFKLVPNEDRNKYLKTVVAFANGKGGRLLFGVADDHTVRGIDKDRVFNEMDAVVDSICKGCAPRVPVDAGIENINGKAVIVVDVFAGSQCPYYVLAEGEKDGVYVRIGATTQRADDATRHELALLSAGRSFDTESCPQARIDDDSIHALCSKMYRIARKNCDTEVERRAVRRVTAEQLEAWGIISRGRGTWVASNAYALLTGDAAFAIRLQCGLFKGDDKALFLDRREYTGSVPELIEQGLEYILEKINMGCYFKGAYRHDRYELPPDEMRELVINAFAHRSYFQHDVPVSIALYDGRVEITSPGGLPRGQTIERALNGFSKLRNSVLAKALKYMHYIEEWGSGLQRVNHVFAEYGLKPVFMEDAGIAVRMNVFRPAKGNTDLLFDKIDTWSENDPVNGGNDTVNGGNDTVNGGNDTVNGENDTVKGGVYAIYKVILANPGIKGPAIYTQFTKSQPTIKRALAKLMKLGKIEYRGSPKTGGYYCCDGQENELDHTGK